MARFRLKAEQPNFIAAGRMLVLLLTAMLTTFAVAQTFPALSGRVVDEAGVIDLAAKGEIETKLQELENKSGIQFAVATVKSLEGSDVETYANRLFRTWKLGEAKNNNGVLLLVAPNERKLRIEVGYGLEGTLTDALAKIVIANAIAPRLKAGDFSGGIRRGVDDVITILTTDASEWAKRPQVRAEDRGKDLDPWIIALAFILFFFTTSMMRRNERSRSGGWARRGGTVFLPLPGGMSGWGGGGWSGGGGFGGGWGGGGGSSGGGGASGEW